MIESASTVQGDRTRRRLACGVVGALLTAGTLAFGGGIGPAEASPPPGTQTGICPGTAAAPPEGGEPLKRYEFSHRQMGTVFRVVMYAPDAKQAHRAAQAAFARIDRLNAVLSDYDPRSELSRLSATAGTGRWVPLSRDLWCVLAFSQRLARQSGGAFDVTVGPVVRLWRRARRQHRLPKPQRLHEALAAVGWEKLQLDRCRRAALLRSSGMRLDLGGVAKGYAVQQALGVLRRHGIHRALVDGGGDLALGGPPPGRRGWRVLLAPESPQVGGKPQYLELACCAVATSGDAFQHVVIGGRRYSHIVDPRSGIGLTTPSTVTVIAPDGMTADALATALSVLGPRQGFALLRAYYPGSAARVVLATEGDSPQVFFYCWPR